MTFPDRKWSLSNYYGDFWRGGPTEQFHQGAIFCHGGIVVAYSGATFSCLETVRGNQVLIRLFPKPYSRKYLVTLAKRWAREMEQEVEKPWHEPRPWPEGGPSEAEAGVRIDAFDDRAEEWREVQMIGVFWYWSDSCDLVETATHWRPKGPAPGAKS